jgi:hypothetical protein
MKIQCSLLIILVSVSCITLAQTVTYSRNQAPSQGIPSAHADINGDGTLDIVSLPVANAGVFGFYLTLSNPDGTHQAPVFYASPYNNVVGPVALGDFNNDGSVDVVTLCGLRSYCIYLNRGDGTLRKSWNFATQPSTVRSALVERRTLIVTASWICSSLTRGTVWNWRVDTATARFRPRLRLPQ